MNEIIENRLRRSVGATYLGIGLNVVLALGKTVGGFVGHSHALIADGIESLADIFSSVIVWRGLVIAAAPADENHPYGHGKAESIASAIVALMLLAAAGWIVVQSVREIITPHHTPAPFTLVILIVVVLAKELLFRRVLATAEAVESSAVKSDAWHHRSDAITSLAAAVGIAVAIVGGKGWEAADDIAALLASLIIAWNGWRILRPALDDLMDAAAPAEVIAQVSTIAGTVPKVECIEKCLVRCNGYFYFVDLHVHVDAAMTVAESHRIAHEVKDTLRARIPRVRDVLVHIEPSGREGGGKSFNR